MARLFWLRVDPSKSFAGRRDPLPFCKCNSYTPILQAFRFATSGDYLNRIAFVGSVLGFSLFLAPVTLADSNPPGDRAFSQTEAFIEPTEPSHPDEGFITSTGTRYRPPTDPSFPQGPTTSTGRRGGCSGESASELTILAPQRYVGQTTASHPTVAWFVPDSQSVPVEIHLYAVHSGGRQRIASGEPMQSSPGLMSWTLPAEQPGLTVGQRYLWQVVLLCNPGRPSSAIVAEAEIEVVAPSMALTQELAETSDPLVRTGLYAVAGLWYDAFREAIAIQGEEATNVRVSLLEDLAESEGSGADRNYEQQARLEQLEQIVEFVRDSVRFSTPTSLGSWIK